MAANPHLPSTFSIRVFFGCVIAQLVPEVKMKCEQYPAKEAMAVE